MPGLLRVSFSRSPHAATAERAEGVRPAIAEMARLSAHATAAELNREASRPRAPRCTFAAPRTASPTFSASVVRSRLQPLVSVDRKHPFVLPSL